MAVNSFRLAGKRPLRFVSRVLRRQARKRMYAPSLAARQALDRARVNQRLASRLHVRAQGEFDRLVDAGSHHGSSKPSAELVAKMRTASRKMTGLSRILGESPEKEDRAILDLHRVRTAGLTGALRRVAAGTRLRTGQRMVDYAEALEAARFADLLGLPQRTRRHKQ